MCRLPVLLAVAAAAVIFPSAGGAAPSILIVNGQLVDGTGSPARPAQIRVQDSRIAEIGSPGALEPRPGERILDAGGRVVAPGFIDCQSHLDRNIRDRPDAPAAVTQGITTVVFGVDGFSHYPLGAYFEDLRRNPVAVNVASYTGHNTLRDQVLPEADNRRPAQPAEIEAMRRLYAQDLTAGSLGLTTGLAYETGVFSDTKEIIGIAEAGADHGGIYTSHIRNESAGVADAIDEALRIGKAAKMPVHISHIKIAMMRLWGTAPEILARLNAGRAHGVDVSADLYPYLRWQTTMRILFPNKRFDDPSGPAMNFRDTVRPEDLILQKYLPDPSLAGRNIAGIAKERKIDPVTLYLALMRDALEYEKAHPDQAGKIESVIGKGMDEHDVETFMAWPQTSICSDGSDGGHPRGYGTFTRVLGRYVRERGLLTLETAVRKMTQLTADHLGLEGRGVIAPGAFADIVIFDPKTVVDRATIDAPTTPSDGIELVMVNGVTVYRDGATTGERPGMTLHRGIR